MTRVVATEQAMIKIEISSPIMILILLPKSLAVFMFLTEVPRSRLYSPLNFGLVCSVFSTSSYPNLIANAFSFLFQNSVKRVVQITRIRVKISRM